MISYEDIKNAIETLPKCEVEKMMEKMFSERCESEKKCLDELLSQNDSVFIAGHVEPDMDAVGAALGMALICKKNKKKNVYIVIDDNVEKIEATARTALKSLKGEFNIIKASQIKDYVTKKSLLIGVDVNGMSRIGAKGHLDKFNDFMIIDHHSKSYDAIETEHTFIDDKLISSACEEVSRLLLAYKVKLEPTYANYIVAGIYLDSKNTTRNTTTFTHRVITDLCERGADTNTAAGLFIEDYEKNRTWNGIIDNAKFQAYKFVFVYDKEGSGNYFKAEDLAKAAEYSLSFGVMASFAIGYSDEETIRVCARCFPPLNVDKIMKAAFGLKNGGKEFAAVADVKGMTIQEVIDKISAILMPTANIEYVIIEKEQEMQLKMGKNVETSQ